MDSLQLIGRTKNLFDKDIGALEPELSLIISDSRFLVLGGAGSMGQSVAKKFLSVT